MIEILDFQHQLLTWYDKHKRDLPWRKGKNPYHIWVSEIMLQQTRVETVIPYFEQFIRLFPTIEKLSSAKEEEVLKAWEGLGYYSRARNLQKGVREVQEKYGGKVPQTLDDILTISGIGPYTAGAILSIAYGNAEPAVDGNVLRVFSRLLNSFEDVTKTKTKKFIEQNVRAVIPHDAASDFNQALMELGATVCTPFSPQCSRCPVKTHCESEKESTQSYLPIKPKKSRVKIVYRIGLLFQIEEKLALVQRPGEGLLANMWELPSLENEDLLSNIEWEKRIQEVLGIGAILPAEPWLTIEHTFSHLKWRLSIYQMDGSQLAQENVENVKNWKLFRKGDIEKLSFPKAYKQVVDLWLQDKDN